MAKTTSKRKVIAKRHAIPGNGQNKWDYEQRLVLRLLFADFSLDGKTASIIFNKLFADHLASCGLPNGLSITAIKGQYQHKSRPTAPQEWQVICRPSNDAKEKARRDGLRDQIRVLLSSSGGHDTQNTNDTPVGSAPSAGVKFSSTSAKRMRSNSQALAKNTNDVRDIEQPATKKPKPNAGAWVVVIPKDEQETAKRNPIETGLLTPPKSPKTPTKSIKRSRSSSRRPIDATITYELPSGAKFLLTPEEFRETQEDLKPIAKADAHPYVPLLFRYSTPTCQSPLTTNGFLAGRFRTTIIPPPAPPSLESFPYSCASQHLDRDQAIASPFISTSNNFIWVLRLALKESMRGAKGGVITLIDPRKLEKGSYFHAQPLHRELRKKRPFSNGAHLYQGMHEFLVWGTVKKEALIATISVEMILDLAGKNHGIGSILRLDQLGQIRVGYLSNVLPVLKQQGIKLERRSITAVAQVCKTLGLKVTMVEAVGSVITDIIQGCGLILDSKTGEEWQAAATMFSNEMCKGSNSATLAEMEGMKYAFLEGCRWANGQFNSRQKPKHMSTMLNKARTIGVESPARILKSGLASAAASIDMYDEPPRKLLRGSANRALLAEPDEEDQFITPTMMGSLNRLADLSIANEDDDGDSAMEALIDDHTSYDAEYDSDGSCYEI